MMYEIELIQTFDSAHRVVGHEGGRGKCARLHGHTYKVIVTMGSKELTPEGFVVDFAVIKATISGWDHRTILWEEDPLRIMEELSGGDLIGVEHDHVVRVPFNPTSENMARHLALELLALDDRIEMVDVTLSETPSSSANYEVFR